MMSRHSATTFPALTADERAHAEKVDAGLRQAIAAAGGWLPFSDYMQFALYEPGLGYYSAGATKFGAAGDFVTAPEISPLFAETIAAALVGPLRAGGRSVLELGGGSGRFAVDVLRALEALQCLPASYRILEVSADLRERQVQALAQLPAPLAARAQHLDQLPVEFRGIIFANEVLDALPVERFVMQGGRPRRVGVVTETDGLRFSLGERTVANKLVEQQIALRLGEIAGTLPDGYSGECCLALTLWIATLADSLVEGVILLIDYGLPRAQLYHPQRGEGTLRCYFRHRAHDDPLFQAGLCDITAWVDFTAVAEAAVANDLEVYGFTTQAAFLLENGIESRLASIGDDLQRARLAHGARQLLMPGEMGESVKVIALSRGTIDELRGFSLQDLLGRL